MARLLPILLASVLLAAAAHAVPMNLHLMTDFVSSGAMCLDGTPGGFYFNKAQNASNANDWILFFEGGGWCYSVGDCWGRSKTALGSSSSWGPTMDAGGLFSSDCSSNPSFCNFNRVYMKYCDGDSFSGNRDEPVNYNGENLYFRGHRIVDAILDTLTNQFGMKNAENVLLTGCSAGGLSTYLHADYVNSVVTANAPNLKRFKAASISGFFLLHNNVQGQPIYPNEIQVIFNLANSTNGVNSKCVASKAPADQWQCHFAQESFKYTTTPFFILDSAADSWQLPCIGTSLTVPPNSTQNGACGACAGWSSCVDNVETCSDDQIVFVNQYMTDFMSTVMATGTALNNGNGLFVYNCYTHCAAAGDDFFKFALRGVTMEQAVSKWWDSPVTTLAAENTYTPCHFNAHGQPRNCNPTC